MDFRVYAARNFIETHRYNYILLTDLDVTIGGDVFSYMEDAQNYKDSLGKSKHTIFFR